MALSRLRSVNSLDRLIKVAADDDRDAFDRSLAFAGTTGQSAVELLAAAVDRIAATDAELLEVGQTLRRLRRRR